MASGLQGLELLGAIAEQQAEKNQNLHSHTHYTQNTHFRHGNHSPQATLPSQAQPQQTVWPGFVSSPARTFHGLQSSNIAMQLQQPIPFHSHAVVPIARVPRQPLIPSQAVKHTRPPTTDAETYHDHSYSTFAFDNDFTWLPPALQQTEQQQMDDAVLAMEKESEKENAKPKPSQKPSKKEQAKTTAPTTKKPAGIGAKLAGNRRQGGGSDDEIQVLTDSQRVTAGLKVPVEKKTDVKAEGEEKKHSMTEEQHIRIVTYITSEKVWKTFRLKQLDVWVHVRAYSCPSFSSLYTSSSAHKPF